MYHCLFSLCSAKAIDEYASLRSKAAESSDDSSKVDPRLEAIVERMLDKYVNYNCSYNSVVIKFHRSHFSFHSSIFPCLGVSWTESTIKLWEPPLNAGD